jgi:hypothetical protein
MGTGFVSRQGLGFFFFSPPRPDRLSDPFSLLFKGTGGSFPLTIELHLLTRLNLRVLENIIPLASIFLHGVVLNLSDMYTK